MKNKKGFTLIELLIVVAIIGIIAAIAIPNLLTALNTSRQRATAGDIKTMGTGIESYVVENGRPIQASAGTLKAAVEQLAQKQRVFFFKRVIDKDGWGNPLQYVGANDIYTIHGPGKDGSSTAAPPLTNDEPVEYIVNEAKCYNYPICFSNGNFTYGPRTRTGV